MGHQIWAGNNEINFSDGAWQVIKWCETFTPLIKPEGISDWEWFERTAGGSEASAESVRTADRMVPMTFEEATSAGLVSGKINKEAFDQCREFLRAAAEAGSAIDGSW